MFTSLPSIIRASGFSAALLVVVQITLFFTAGVGQDPLQFFHPAVEAPPCVDHRLLDRIVGVHHGAEHAEAVSREGSAVYFELSDAVHRADSTIPGRAETKTSPYSVLVQVGTVGRAFRPTGADPANCAMMAKADMGNIKGIGLIGIAKALRRHRDIVEKRLPQELEQYLCERIVLTSWYPEEHYLALLRLYVQTWAGRSYEEVGQLGAREALQTTYRNILFGGVESAARRMHVNWRNYHDTGDLSAEILPGMIRIRVSNYAIEAVELCRLNTGYFGELLKLAGAHVTASRKPCCVCMGDVDCVWEFDWVSNDAAGAAGA